MIIATAIANRHRQSPIAIAVQSALPPRVESCAVVHMQVAIVGLYFMNIFQLVRKIGAGMQLSVRTRGAPPSVLAKRQGSTLQDHTHRLFVLLEHNTRLRN